MLTSHLDRRGVLAGGAMLGLSGLALPRLASAQAAERLLAFDNPRDNVRTMARLTATLEPGKTGYVRYQGKTFALLADGRNLPLFDLDGIGALRALPQPDGAYRFLFSEFALYLDPATGRPLERWTNPVSGRAVDVWHMRNGPVNYELSPAKATFGAFSRTGADGAAPGFQLPWVRRGPFATFALDVVSNRPNPLDPAQWPLESTGKTLAATEHSQYAVLERDVLNPRLPSLQFFASLQSVKPWHPWMLLGETPGRIFTRSIAQKVSGPEVLGPERLAFARANLAEWMDAPTAWTGQYVTQQAIYKATRTPQR